MSTELVLTNIKVNAVPARIEFDAPALNAIADEYLEKYTGYVVTAEGLADDKKLAQELGRHATQLNRFRIDTKKQLTEPIAQFENDIKSVADKFQSVRQLIVGQVDRFEAESLAEIKQVITGYFNEQREALGIRDEYARFDIGSLVMLTAITKSGNLTAKTQREADAQLQQALQLQNMVDLRLSQLETECYKLGLSAPLTRAHVQHIIELENNEYAEQLKNIIDAEIEREKQAVEAQRKKLEREAYESAQAKIRAEQAAEQVKSQEAAHSDVQQEPQAAEQSFTVKTIVTCVFELDVASSVASERIEQAVRDKLAEAGFTTLSEITIKRG